MSRRLASGWRCARTKEEAAGGFNSEGPFSGVTSLRAGDGAQQSSWPNPCPGKVVGPTNVEGAAVRPSCTCSQSAPFSPRSGLGLSARAHPSHGTQADSIRF